MSVNRCSTDCKCGFWTFLHEPDGEVPIGDKSLLTIDEYMTAVGSTRDRTNSGHGHGYGYRDDLSGEVYGWYNKCGDFASFDAGPEYEKRLLWAYEPIPETDRYRWRQLACPFCNRTYAGWYRLQPHGMKRNGYELYDLSFWWAFNDEPDRRDECWLREWTVDEVRLMLSAWKLRYGPKRGELMEDPKRCPKCAHEAAEPHRCPYQGDVNNDDEFTCECCEECTQACADDI